jgi:hypothetical protein
MGTDDSVRTLSADLIRRLAFVRYLYGLGVEQSHRPEPLASVALLTFHDASEMFLQIIAEHHQVVAKRPEFMAYWGLLKETGVELSSYQQMQRLNTARVTLKHSGVLPGHTEIEGFRSSVSGFLWDNATSALGIVFDQVSLTLMIASVDVRSSLERAQAELASGDLKAALGDATIAFIRCMREHEVRPRVAREHGSTGYSLHSASREFHSLFQRMQIGQDSGRLTSAINHLVDVFSEAIMVVGYNLNFESYLTFKTHAPVVHQFASGRVEVEWMRAYPTDADAVSRCINFVIDTAIRLQGAAP